MQACGREQRNSATHSEPGDHHNLELIGGYRQAKKDRVKIIISSSISIGLK
jgi:hypothetical protein